MTLLLRAPVLALLGAASLLALYLSVSLGMPGSGAVGRYSSGILDLDVSRVVADVTSERRAYRASVHPLQKLLLAPLGGAIHRVFFDGANALAAAKWMVALFTVANVLACAWLAGLLCGGARAPAVAAGLLAGSSFSTLLAASIPESAAFASLGAVLPQLLLAARWERRFSRVEACAWSGVALIGIGLTLTQIVHTAIALSVRLALSPGARAGRGRLAPGLLTLVLAAAAIYGATQLQAHLYPRSPQPWTSDLLASERPWLRSDELRAAPVRHAARLAGHFLVIDFAAPFPTYSDFLMRDGLDYWSLSLEERAPGDWPAGQLALGALVLAAVSTAAVLTLRSADARWLAPALGVSSQLGLHLLYGREYVLYAPHWHGVLVALLVAGAWRGLGPRRRWLPAVAALLSALLLVNNLAVMRSIYRDVRFGLEAEHRDAEGRLRFRSTPRPRPAPPRSSSPPGASDDTPSAGAPD